MDIPINAEIYCADGPCGRSTYVVIDPATRQVTHVVVKEDGFPFAERLVPLDRVIDSTPTSIQLRSACDELSDMERFIETEYLEGSEPFFGYTTEEYMLWPYFAPEMIVTQRQRLPPGELAIHRGAAVHAADGRVGQVDEFLIDPQDEHITHLILREGHLWGKKDVTIPVSEIERIADNAVYLKLDKRTIEALPAVPVHN
jgi:sporulation protein YlmC with PRC-barrel domain